MTMYARVGAVIAAVSLSVGFHAHAQSNARSDAQTKSSQEAAVIEQHSVRVRFASDGTSTRETTAAIHIYSEAGVQAFGQLVIGYASATERLEVNHVRVRKPDGQVIETPGK